MKAIQTKYIGPTNTRGSRIKAWAEGGNQITVGMDHELNADQNHLQAAKALATKLNWSGEWISGGSADGTGCVFVNTRCSDKFTV